MRVTFPYPGIAVDVPDRNLMGIYALPVIDDPLPERQVIQSALSAPIGTRRLRDMARGCSTVLVVCDDVSRPTPAHRILPSVLEELSLAGVEDHQIEFTMALGTHRPMTSSEIAAKVGADVAQRYRVHNHAWDDPASLRYMGDTDGGVPV